MGDARYFVWGCYIPPFNTAGTAFKNIQQVIGEKRYGSIPVIQGNLHVNVQNPRNDREEDFVEAMDTNDMSGMTRHFGQRRGRRLKGRSSYRRSRGIRIIALNRTNCWRGETRRRMGRGHLVTLRHQETDNRAIVARFGAGNKMRLNQYWQRHQWFPIELPRCGPRSKSETLVKDLVDVTPSSRDRKRE